MNLTLKNSATPLIGVLVVACLSLGISGGPDYGGSKRFRNITGSYAGALLPAPLDDTGMVAEAKKNDLGIFTVAIPQIGLATGDFIVFTSGRTFVGTIQGIGNPNKATLVAALQAIPVVSGGVQTQSNEHADGNLHAKVKAPQGSTLAISSIRLVGTAHTTTTRGGVVEQDGESNYTVDGFKQSN